MAWYYSVNGKAEGPVSREFLIEGLRAGRLTLVDLAFKEGSQAWSTLGEFPEFKDAYNNPLPAPMESEKAPAKSYEPAVMQPGRSGRSSWEYAPAWVVLKQKEKGFDQEGPYSEHQIIEMIASGVVSYSQYAWKPGYKRWVRIGNLPEFDRRKRDREGDSVNQIIPLPDVEAGFPVLTREELLGAIERLQPKMYGPRDSQPPEATGPDLANSYSDMDATRISTFDVTRIATYEDLEKTRVQPMQSAAQIEKTKPTAPPPAAYSDSERELPPPASMKAQPLEPTPEEEELIAKAAVVRKKIIRALVATSSAVVLVAGAFHFLSSRPNSTEASSEAEATTGQEKADEVNPVSAPAVAKTSAPPAAAAPEKFEAPTGPVREATVVDIVPLRLATSKPALAFQSDIGVGDLIRVEIEARTGDILDYPSYFSEHEVRRASGEIGTLDLAALKLPNGSYRVRARAGAALDEILIFVGVRDAAFEKAREKHLKSIASQQQAERKAMYYGAQRLEVLTRDLSEKYKKYRREPASWQKYFASWKSAAKEASRPAVALVYNAKPNDLAFRAELKYFQLTTEKLAGYARQLDASVTQKRDIAGTPESELVTDFSRLRQMAARLSGR